ncbi:MAG TPA: hypothetical protein VEC19_14785 [Usitatibacter sp.]|nr:hypothetical protein [Usitatibacter sp.]
MSSITGIGGVSVGDVKGLDLETAMMMVQSQRANLLEGQLKTQLDGIQDRNKEIAHLNDLIGKLKSLRPGGTDAEKAGPLGGNVAEAQKIIAELKAAGCSPVPGGTCEVRLKDGTVHSGLDEAGRAEAQHCVKAYWAFRSGDYSGGKAVVSITDKVPDVKQKDFDVFAEQLKGKIDSLNSSQQMDMLRMQGLTNKRNEAFDLMTNFIKKMADSRSSVLGNMR